MPNDLNFFLFLFAERKIDGGGTVAERYHTEHGTEKGAAMTETDFRGVKFSIP